MESNQQKEYEDIELMESFLKDLSELIQKN